MNKNDFLLVGVIIGFVAGLLIGFILGCCTQMKSDSDLLKKLGIEIIETRVFNGEPEYSYRTVEPIKKEKDKGDTVRFIEVDKSHDE